MSDSESLRAEVEGFQAAIGRLREEMGRVIVGHREVIDGVVTCLLAGSHALLEGVPGLGKTLLVRSLAQAFDVPFARIQFTPDLMPADIIGTTVVEDGDTGKTVFEFRKGPVFANVVLADEINRATPKTQSALLEAMQEHRVTVGRTTYDIGEPYFVLATQNPIEMEGTYPLPEAQLDRFFYKLHVPFPSRDELHQILDRTTTNQVEQIKPVLTGKELLALRQLVLQVPVSREVQDYAVRVLQATHPEGEEATDQVRRFVRIGASPRGAQAMLLGAKVRALLEGRFAPSCGDIRAAALPALRHRLLLSFEGEAEGINADEVIRGILDNTSEASP